MIERRVFLPKPSGGIPSPNRYRRYDNTDAKPDLPRRDQRSRSCGLAPERERAGRRDVVRQLRTACRYDALGSRKALRGLTSL